MGYAVILALLAAARSATTTTTTTAGGTTTTTTTAGGTYPLPAASSTAPYAPLSPNVIPTYDGSGATIHPSVVDLGPDGWNGFRWWLADTPYPNADDDFENPSIFASNDRLNWTVPAGLTNPLAGNPASAEFPDAFHSDPELEFDPDTGTLWLWWRLAPQYSPPYMEIKCASSTDGSTWTLHGTVLTLTETPWASPAIVRMGPGDWRMFLMSGSAATRRWSAPSPLGPWTYVGYTSQASQLNGQFRQYHGDIIYHDGYWWALRSMPGAYVYAHISADGINWSPQSAGLMGGGWLEYLYRPTLVPSTEAGYMDVWCSGNADLPGGKGVGYSRIPLSVWTDLLP